MANSNQAGVAGLMGLKKFLLGKHLMFWMFIASYSAVHMIFELQYWLTDERDIFNKYEMVEGLASQLEVAKKVYFTKASWMFALVTLNAFGLNFRTAMALSFFIYSIELVLLFPARTYTLLNLVLALGMLMEQGLEWQHKLGINCRQ
jgi:hypothetical protein